MEEENSKGSQSPVTTKDDPPGSQVVQQEATGGSDKVQPNNLGDGVVGSGGEEGGEGEGSGLLSVEISMKRKRGRPRKYDADANTVSMVWPPPPGFSSSRSGSYEKRSRGRPRGSGKLQLLASLGGFAAETAGGSFTPHVVTVQTGEDAVGKILSLAQKGPRAVCILSATGAVSSVIIRQPGSSGGILRYDGRFEILSLSGSFTFGAISSAHRKNGMLSVSLAKPDGRVFGGGVAGSLIAAVPIQLIVASFKQNISNELRRRQSVEPSTVASVLGNSDMVKVPIQITGITDGEENCTTPTSALLEIANGEVGNMVAVNENVNPDTQNGDGITDGEENCATPTSALLETTNGGAGNTVAINENVSPDTQNGDGPGGQNVFQSLQSISAQRVSPDVNDCVL